VSVERTLVVRAEAEEHERIRLARLAAGNEPEEMAEALGVSLRTYQRIEAGVRAPSRLELQAIAERTGQELSFFGASGGEGEAVLPPPLPRVNDGGGA
jgi:transcriptional regulator with XRE-family HTH domain